jgi:hypothetical protein
MGSGWLFGMSVEMIDRVYGHHHPDHLRKAALALGYRRRQSLAVAKAVTPPSRKSLKSLVGPPDSNQEPDRYERRRRLTALCKIKRF